MRFDFADRRGAERFAELLDESPRRRHDGSQTDERLGELVAIGDRLSAARPAVQVDQQFRVGLRAMLVATAERDGIGVTASAPETEPSGPAAVRERFSLLGRGSARRIRARGAIVIGVAAGAMAVSGISAASENAAPGDALYGVKRQTEKAQLAMAGSDVTRGQLSLDFARTRLAEAVAMKGVDRSFPKVLEDMDADTRQGVKLLTSSAVARRDTAPLATVDGFAGAQRRTLEPVLERLSTVNRDRAARSIALLDEVRRRAAGLRTGLACEPVTPAGADNLGPRLTDCADGDPEDTPAERPAGQNAKPGGKPATGPADKVEKNRTGKPATSTGPGAGPDSDAASTGGDSDPADSGDTDPQDATPSTDDPAPSRSNAPKNGNGTGSATEDGGVVDDVLKGILGK